MIHWPDFTFPPINLLNITPSPEMLKTMEPKDTVKTQNFKSFSHKECEFFPCHGDEDQNCLFCYCPLAWLECPGKFTIIESPKGVFRKDCSGCKVTHSNKGGWELVQKWLEYPKPYNFNDKNKNKNKNKEEI